MTRDELSVALLDRGWREGGAREGGARDYTRMFYKQFDTPTRCHGNSDHAGIQCTVEATELPGIYPMAEVEIAGELSDGTWVALKQWAMPMEVSAILGVIPRLLTTWECAANCGGPDASK